MKTLGGYSPPAHSPTRAAKKVKKRFCVHLLGSHHCTPFPPFWPSCLLFTLPQSFLFWGSIFKYIYIYLLFRTALRAYGGSQARGLIEATATSLCQSHSDANPSHICDLHHRSWQRQILIPLHEARDQPHNLMVPGPICFRCTTMGTPQSIFCWDRDKNYN